MSEPHSSLAPSSPAAPRQHLTLFDSTCIIVGIIIGAGIYETTWLIASNVPARWTLLPAFTLLGWSVPGVVVPGAYSLVGVWILGGILSLIGALCYAELANMYPKEGGDYVYLTRGYGRPIGFLFAWSQLWVVRPGSIGAMAYIFARYANRLVPLDSYLGPIAPIEPAQMAMLVYAAGSVLILSLINLLNVQTGKWTQNLLTVVKFLGLAAVCVVGLSVPSSPSGAAAPAAAGKESLDIGLAMILVLFAYGGWNEMAYVGSEVRNPSKNILLALLLGTLAVMACYVVATLAFLHAFGFEGVRGAKAVAADVMQLRFGPVGEKLISLLIAVSALGSINGQIFTGARIYYAMGSEHRLYAVLGQWSQRLGTPVWSLVIQAAITLALVIGFGLSEGAFERMVIFTTPVFWVFMWLVALAVYKLRDIEPGTARPYRVPWYPFTPFIFGVSSLFMVYRSVVWAVLNSSPEAFWSLGLLAVGILLCGFDPKPSRPPSPTPPS